MDFDQAEQKVKETVSGENMLSQSGDTQIWKISPNLEKFQISKLEKSSKFGEMAIFNLVFGREGVF